MVGKFLSLIVLVLFAGCEKSSNDLPKVVSVGPENSEIVVPGNTKELITLKGVDFDKPDARVALLELCDIDKKLEAYLGAYGSFCVFEDGVVEFMNFVYGNVNEDLPNGLLGPIAKARVDGAGALVRFEMPIYEIDTLLGLLVKKYGEARAIPCEVMKSAECNQVQQELKHVYVWVDDIGTRLTLYEYLRLENGWNGQVIIESASSARAADLNMRINMRIKEKIRLQNI